MSLFLVWAISRFIFSGVKIQGGVSGIKRRYDRNTKPPKIEPGDNVLGVKPSKCQFGFRNMNFVGHTVGSGDLRPGRKQGQSCPESFQTTDKAAG